MAWRSVGGATVTNSGEVEFCPAPDGTGIETWITDRSPITEDSSPAGAEAQSHTAALPANATVPCSDEDQLSLLFTAALAVQRPPEDHQRYRRDDAEHQGQRERPKPDEYPCDEDAEDHRDGCDPGV